METRISEFYTHDHDVLDQNFKSFQELKTKDYPLAKEYFRKFMFGLRQHIKWEEEILFPLFESKTGMQNGGPTEVMRHEHAQILRLLDALHEKVRRLDVHADTEESELKNVLHAHNEKEEMILYPAIDQVSSDHERASVFVNMEKSLKVQTGCGGGGCCCH